MLGTLGTINSPFDTLAPGKYPSAYGGGIIVIFSNLIKLFIVVAGIYTLLNFILAGFGFIGSSGDPKVMQHAQERITRSIMGLIVIVGSFVIAAIVGFILFGPSRWDLLINPVIYGPSVT